MDGFELQEILDKIRSTFAGEKMETRLKINDSAVDSYFPDFELAVVCGNVTLCRQAIELEDCYVNHFDPQSEEFDSSTASLRSFLR